MIHLEVQGRAFTIEFRHRRLKRTNAPIRAVTTCVLIGWKSEGIGGIEMEETTVEFIAIENAICVTADPFSRSDGRDRALLKVLQHCGPLRGCRAELWMAYRDIHPEPLTSEERRETARALRAAAKLPEQQKRERWAAGWEKRKAREIAKTKGGGA